MTELQQSREFVIEARRVAVNYGKNVGSVRPNLIRWGRERDRSRSHPTRERLRFFPPTIMIRFSGLLFALRLRLILTFFAFRFLAMS